ncbi:hypothetical protein ACLI07_15020 [Providencia huaxiensis]|uniref:hypothetical protein n=1 Tax=Providencia huaxiensis TaxID=2027290 RepID=UPI003D2B900E
MSWRIALLLIISCRKQSTGYATFFSPHTPQMTIARFLMLKIDLDQYFVFDVVLGFFCLVIASKELLL